MKPKFYLPLTHGTVVISLALATGHMQAADVLKGNNTDALNLTTSWVGGATPTSSDVAVWDSTVTATNTTTLGANLNWAGIRIANPTGTVTIGNTADTTTLTLGSSGIDMSSATQNLQINSNLIATSAQTWSVASGRTLQIQTLNTNRTLTGSGNISLVNSTGSGTATFDFRPGSNGSTAFTAQAGFSGYTGNWTIGAGTLVKTLRNGINAWGSGTITLAGGTVGQRDNFSGTWTNNIILQDSTTSFIDDFNTSGTRSLKLNGIISGSGNLTFQETNAGTNQNAETCYVLTGTNAMSGTVTVASGTFLRVGGDTGNDSSMGAGTTGTLGTATVTNNGTLSFTRNNAHTVANSIGGSGLVNIGSNNLTDTTVATGTATATQIVTLNNANTYAGGTNVMNGTLLVNNITGSGTGTGTVTVSGGTLGGNGNIAGAVNVTGTLAPGTSIESLSTGALTFNSGSTFAYELDSVGLNGDLLDSSGNLNLNGTVTLTLSELFSGVLNVGDKLTLINYTGSWNNGTFTYQGNTLADESTITVGSNLFRFDYNDTTGGSNFANDQIGATGFVTMTVVPEPAVALLGGLGMLTLLRRRRA